MNAKTKEVTVTNESNVVPIQRTQEESVMYMLQTALEKGVDADSLEKLLNMQERILDRQAEQAYTSAMVKVQEEMTKKGIEEDGQNTQTNSTYSKLEAINKVLVPIYTKHGFSLSFGQGDSPLELHVRILCDVMHVDGHSKHYHNDMPLDMTGIAGKQNKTKIHGTGSALKYGRRYLTNMIFNISTGDVDDDGNAAGQAIEYISDIQLNILTDLISATETNETQFCKVCKVPSLDMLPVNKYDHSHKLLKDKQEGLK